MAQLDLALDRSSDVPLGTQLAWKLRGAVASGALRPGDRLPGVRELAETAGVNVNTVRSVVARLGEQGLIVSEHGRGTFVAQGLADRSDLREIAQKAASDARRLGVDPRELAALLYAETAPGPAGDPTSRAALREEIDRLEQELTTLDAQLGKSAERTPPRRGRSARLDASPRLLGTDELERVRDRLVAQVADRHERIEAANAPAPEPEPTVTRDPWPELIFSRPAPRGA